MIDVQKLAAEFARKICDALSAEQLDTVNAWNGIACKTHNYCDANQCMLDALHELNIEFNPQDSAQAVAIDAAWGMARRCEFNATDIENLFRR